MAHTSKLSKYLKADHVKDGDIINFIDPGRIENKDFSKTKDGSDIRPVLEMTVEINGDKKTYSPNSATVGILSKAWGEDSINWVAKQARITVVPNAQSGRDMIICKPI